jgi:hypothetical protein
MLERWTRQNWESMNNFTKKIIEKMDGYKVIITEIMKSELQNILKYSDFGDKEFKKCLKQGITNLNENMIRWMTQNLDNKNIMEYMEAMKATILSIFKEKYKDKENYMSQFIKNIRMMEQTIM